jgi:hypothetical protein
MSTETEQQTEILALRQRAERAETEAALASSSRRRAEFSRTAKATVTTGAGSAAGEESHELA